MTAFNPELTVTINGVSYNSKTVDSVNITYGRTSVWEQARTGYANVKLIQTVETFIDFDINDPIVITLKNSSAVTKTLFTGTINDIEYSRANQGLALGTTFISLSAVGPFAKMARTLIGGSNYPKENDSVRMNRILTEAGVTIDVVDSPGIYELDARTALVSDAYSLAGSTAGQVFGYIYETPDGKVGYANQSHRLNDVQAGGYLTLPASYILWNTLTTNRNLNNLLNDITLTYRAGEVTASSAGSISLFGRQAGKVETTLHDLTDAQDLADFYIATRANAHTNLSTFSMFLQIDGMSSADRNELIEVYLGKPIDILDLPASLYDGVFTGFVEGWRWSIDRMRARLDITCTDSTLTIVPTRWQDVDPAQKWNMVGATIRWLEYE